MAISTNIPAPVFSATIDQTYLIEPLQGAKSPLTYLDRFPEGVYNKSIDTHLVKLIYALIGPAGVGGIKTNLLQARLIFESQGLNIFDMDAFYGNPFKFGRIVEESYNQNIQGALPIDQWKQIAAQDEAYRARAIQYFKGIRAGGTPLGMQLIAQSGMGHNVEIVENYQYLYDIHSDDPLGLPYYGKTAFLEEFIILPRQNIPQSTQQQLAFNQNYGNAGFFYLTYMGQQSGPIPVGANALTVQAALQGLGSIGQGNVQVIGGPNPNPFSIYFRGNLANEQTDTIKVTSEVFQAEITGNIPVDMTTATTKSGFETFNEVYKLSDQNRHDLQVALDYIRPMTTFPTVNEATGKTSRQPWNSVVESSSYVETRTFVTGQPSVNWPPVLDGDARWIEPDVEKEAPSVGGHKPYHYVKFYRPSNVYAYTDAALDDPNYLTDINEVLKFPDQRTGPFSAPQIQALPFFSVYNQRQFNYLPISCLNPQPDPVFATNRTLGGTQLFNNYYPREYIALVSDPAQTRYFYQLESQRDYYFGIYYNYKFSQGHLAPFWSSSDRASGTDYLEIDLGTVQPINFLMFETTHKPVNIQIQYDLLDDPNRRKWADLYPLEAGYFETGVVYTQGPPWEPLQYLFQTKKGTAPYSRYLRIGLTRRTATPNGTYTPSDLFLWDSQNKVQDPWSIEMRNLRIGINVNQIATKKRYRYNVPPAYWL